MPTRYTNPLLKINPPPGGEKKEGVSIPHPCRAVIV